MTQFPIGPSGARLSGTELRRERTAPYQMSVSVSMVAAERIGLIGGRERD